MSDGFTGQSTALALRKLARLHGLELSDAEARDLLPYYELHQHWLEELRLVLGDGEEPATRFAVAGADDVPE